MDPNAIIEVSFHEMTGVNQIGVSINGSMQQGAEKVNRIVEILNDPNILTQVLGKLCEDYNDGD